MEENNNNTEISKTDFFNEVSKTFPESDFFTNQFDEDNDLPYLRMGGLANYAIKQIAKGDIENFKSIINFVESQILIADSELFNLIGVGFVEDIIFIEGKAYRETIVKMLPEQISYMYESIRPIFDK